MVALDSKFELGGKLAIAILSAFFFLRKRSIRTDLVYSLMQWNGLSDVTGCTWVVFIQWRQRIDFTAPGCSRAGACSCWTIKGKEQVVCYNGFHHVSDPPKKKLVVKNAALENRRVRKRWRRPQILHFCGDDRRIRSMHVLSSCLIRRSSPQNCKVWGRRHLLQFRLCFIWECYTWECYTWECYTCGWAGVYDEEIVCAKANVTYFHIPLFCSFSGEDENTIEQRERLHRACQLS